MDEEFALDKSSWPEARCRQRQEAKYESHHSETDGFGAGTPRRIAEERRGLSDPHRARMARCGPVSPDPVPSFPALEILGLLGFEDEMVQPEASG
jgi:hypothetical protein